MTSLPVRLAGAAVCLFTLTGYGQLPARTNDSPSFVYHPSAQDWRTAPVYQVITDRFADGDPLNNDDHPGSDVNPFGAISIHGGDFEGIEAKLDYIHMLGYRSIWISPVVRNVKGTFHGYAAQDFTQIDPHWGTLEDLQRMIDAAHAKGMYVFIDVVQNHMGDLLTSTQSGFPSFNLSGYNMFWRDSGAQHAAPFNDIAKFYNHGSVSDWGDATQVLLGDFVGLDGVRTEDAQVRQDMIDVYQALIAATDCDGFRVDTAKHVEMDFWETFLPAIDSFADGLGKTNFLVFAEVFDGSETTVSAYTATNRFNSVLTFPLRQTMEDVFVWNQPTSWLTDRFNDLSLYDASARDQLVNFIDNHDMARLLSSDRLAGNAERLKVAMAFLHTFVNIPALYYGTEQGFNGVTDPMNREDMFDGEFESGPSSGDAFNYLHDLFLYIRNLNLLRQAYPALVSGEFNERWQSFSGGGLYVFSRLSGTQEVIVALNTASTPQEAMYAGAGPSTAQPADTELVNLLDPTESLIVGNGGATNKITFTVPGYGVKLFTPRDQVQPLPPTLIDAQPGHSTGDVLLSSDIQMSFDQPMDPASVETAFTTIPALPGTFAWNSSNTFVLFTPSEALASNTAYTMSLSSTASATNGLAIGSRYESQFSTGAVLGQNSSLGSFVLDGILDAGATLIALNNGIPLYVAYDATNKALYVATVDAGEGNDHFIFLDDALDGSAQPIPSWNKNGTVAWDGPFLADENDNDFVSWLNVQASASAATGPNGGVLEGVINLGDQYGTIPPYLYLSVGLYGTADAGSLLSSHQVPASHNQDQNIDNNEFARYSPLTGEVVIEAPPFNPQEVPLTQYTIDGQFSLAEQGLLKTNNGVQNLYIDFNGSLLYAATQDAGEGSDHFILVTDQPEGLLSAPWAKSGMIAGRKHFLADENDTSFEGWFINNAYDASHPAATPINNGGALEGTLDLVQAFGSIPDAVYLAVAPYQTADGGTLYSAAQVPAGNGDGTVDSNELYRLDMRSFDTDGDGIPDLDEDLNRNGVMDEGETGARVIDSDGDAVDDGSEVISGSDPTDAASQFTADIQFTAIPLPSGIVIAWTGITGRLYSVHSTPALTGSSTVWTNTGYTDAAGTNGLMTYVDSSETGSGTKYFRVQVRLAGD